MRSARPAIALLILLLATGAARAECPPFPEVPWWEGLSHETTRRYVQQKYDGNWSDYIAKWQRQLGIIENIYARGKAGIIKDEGIRLEGEDLRRYVEQIEQRLAVIECLARESLTGGTARAPAATTEIDIDAPPLAGDGTPSQTGGGYTLLLEMAGVCKGPQAIFRVTNRGRAWPRTAEFTIRRLTDEKLITQRRLRLATDQQIAFRVDEGGKLELRIVPDWRPQDVRSIQVLCQ